MRFDFSKLTKPEIEEIIENANFTEDEETVFRMLTKKKSCTEIAYKLLTSQSTVDRRIKSIKEKVVRIIGCYQKS